VIPAAIFNIGGAIEHFGMPSNPCNLLLIAAPTACRSWGPRLPAFAVGERF